MSTWRVYETEGRTVFYVWCNFAIEWEKSCYDVCIDKPGGSRIGSVFRKGPKCWRPILPGEGSGYYKAGVLGEHSRLCEALALLLRADCDGTRARYVPLAVRTA